MKNLIEGQSLWKVLFSLLCVGILGCEEGDFPDLSQETIEHESCHSSIFLRNALLDLGLVIDGYDGGTQIEREGQRMLDREQINLERLLESKGYTMVENTGESVIAMRATLFREDYDREVRKTPMISYWHGLEPRRVTKVDSWSLERYSIESLFFFDNDFTFVLRGKKEETSGNYGKKVLAEVISEEFSKISKIFQKFPSCKVVQNADPEGEHSIGNLVEKYQLKDD